LERQNAETSKRIRTATVMERAADQYRDRHGAVNPAEPGAAATGQLRAATVRKRVIGIFLARRANGGCRGL